MRLLADIHTYTKADIYNSLSSFCSTIQQINDGTLCKINAYILYI